MKLYAEVADNPCDGPTAVERPAYVYDDPNVLSDDFQNWLLSYARMLNLDQAEDAVQEAYTVLLNRIQRPPPVENPRGYLVRVVQRKIKRRKKSPLSLIIDQNYYDSYPDPDLARAIAALPERQQACLALRYGKDLTIAATADHMQVTESTVRSYLARAIERLGRELGDIR